MSIWDVGIVECHVSQIPKGFANEIWSWVMRQFYLHSTMYSSSTTHIFPAAVFSRWFMFSTIYTVHMYSTYIHRQTAQRSRDWRKIDIPFQGRAYEKPKGIAAAAASASSSSSSSFLIVGFPFHFALFDERWLKQEWNSGSREGPDRMFRNFWFSKSVDRRFFIA